MYKGIIAIIVLSIVMIFTSSYCAEGLQWMIDGHHWIDTMLAHVFSTDKVGTMLAQLASYLVLPFGVASVIALIYGMTRKHVTPYFMHITWAVWLVQTTALMIYS